MDHKTFTSDLAARLGCDPAKASNLLETFATIVREECAATNRVAIPGFGSFEGVKHDEEIVNDLAAGCRMLLPPSIEVVFTPGVMMKKKLNEPLR